MPAPHVHACAECDPALKPSEFQESIQHFGVQFGHRHHTALLYDEEVDGAYEAMSGEDGWILRWAQDEKGDRHLCPHPGSGVCAERVAGNVRVEAMVSA